MFLCLILLASSILAPGQSAPSLMDEFVAHVLAPLFTNGKCHKGTKYENVHFGFDAFERRCETAVVLDQTMAELRELKGNMDGLIQRIRDRVYDYDVIELEAQLHKMEKDFPESRVGELEEEFKKSMLDMEPDQDHRQAYFEQLMEANEKAMAAFQERPSFETAYSLIRIASHSGYVSYIRWYGVEREHYI